PDYGQPAFAFLRESRIREEGQRGSFWLQPFRRRFLSRRQRLRSPLDRPEHGHWRRAGFWSAVYPNQKRSQLRLLARLAWSNSLGPASSRGYQLAFHRQLFMEARPARDQVRLRVSPNVHQRVLRRRLS